MKVVWICHFSNELIRNHLRFSKLYYRNLIGLLKGERKTPKLDSAVWVTNGIREFEKYRDIDLTVVFPYTGISGRFQWFESNGIKYVAYRPSGDNFLSKLRNSTDKQYTKDRKVISNILNKIKPDIVHLIGAENPEYSLSLLDVSPNVATIVSLQTLMSKPGFLENYPIERDEYEYRTKAEKAVIKRADYIGAGAKSTRNVVRDLIKPDAVFLKMTLAVGVDIDTTFDKKEFDFVYFAADISKACDIAVEAFALAHKKDNSLRLNIVGGYQQAYKQIIDARLMDLGIEDAVIFSGPQPTHDDVLRQIKKSSFALLPLKVDLVSGTIREAMACGLPVVTTVTAGTPSLNEERESVLLANKEDFDGIANQMLRLVSDKDYAGIIRDNAILTVQERYSNSAFMEHWRLCYHEIYDNIHSGKTISEDVIVKD